MIHITEMLSDDALKISLDHRLVKRPPFADDALSRLLKKAFSEAIGV